MKIYDIVLFIFLFNLSLGIVNDITPYLGIDVETNPGYYCLEWDESGNCVSSVGAKAWVSDESGGPSSLVRDVSDTAVNPEATFSWLNAIYAFVFKGIPAMVRIIFSATIGVLPLMLSLHIPVIVAAPISAVVYLLYTFGLYQFILDRSIKNYE